MERLLSGANSGLETTGNIIITDDETILVKTPQDYFDEVETIGTDGLPTLVPLPPDNEAFDSQTKITPLPKAAQGATGPITVSGTWPPAGAASPPVTSGLDFPLQPEPQSQPRQLDG